MDAPERDARPDLIAPEEPGPAGAAAAPAARLERARAHGFVPLLMLLDRLRPGAADVGGEAAPELEAVRFRHDPSLAFSTSDVAAVQERVLPPDPTDFTDRPRSRWDVTTTFLGLTGAVSPLPSFVSEEILQRDADDGRNRDFLDLFHHRVLSFLARGWLKYDPAASHLSDFSDPWSRRLLAWIGEDVQDRGEDPSPSAPWLLLRAGPLLAERALTADGLQALLEDSLGEALEGEARIAVEQFTGSWVPIPEEDRTRLGVSASALGQSTVLGRQVLDPASGVAVVVGPLDRGGYRRFALEREARDRLQRAMATLTRGALRWHLILRLTPEAAPPARLGAAGSRLGVDAWLGKQGGEARLRFEAPS